MLLHAAAHPYTVALRSAVPEVDVAARRSRIVLPGDPPDAANPPSGCVFHPRCPLAIDRCRTEVPALRAVAPGQQVACHRAEDVLAGAEMPSGTEIPSLPGDSEPEDTVPGDTEPAPPSRPAPG